MIYRGQKYGDPVGEWWTSSRTEAVKFAMSRGGNRTWVVLVLDEDNEEWLVAHSTTYDRAGDDKGTWYRIPLDKLKERWRGVRIIDGAIDLG
jgi:hypothetical protein